MKIRFFTPARRWLLLAIALAATVRAQNATAVVTVDESYNVTVNGSVQAMGAATGGKVVISGSFDTVNGVARSGLARLEADGSLDVGFNPSVTGSVNAIAVQPDGRIVIAGDFTTVNGVARAGVARLNNDGTLDLTFNPAAGPNVKGSLGCLVPLADGRLLIGGAFASFNSRARAGIARLLADGSVDETFVPFNGATALDQSVTALVVDAAGRVLYANTGLVITSGVKPPAVGRLNPNGTVDSSFTPGVVSTPTGGVYALLPQADGRIFIGGSFTNYNGVVRNRLARLEANGAVDPTFVPDVVATNLIARLVPADDGALYVFRRSTTSSNLAGTLALTRLTAAGRLDETFGVGFTSTQTNFSALLPQAGGTFLVGGGTLTAGGVTRSGVIRTRNIPGPVITVQPRGGFALAGGRGVLSVTVVGALNATYQWFCNGVPVAEGDHASVGFDATAASVGGWFVRITHAGGVLDSAVATVTVEERPPIFSSTSALTGLGGTMQTGTRFALTAPAIFAGSPPLQYQWFKDGVALPGETRSALFKAAWSPADTGTYAVTVTNSLGTLTSDSVYQGVGDGAPWTWVRPAIQGNTLNHVQSVGGRLLAAGERGTIVDITGSDGRLYRASGSAAIGPIAYGNGTFVALTPFGGVQTSRDGASWVARESGVVNGATLERIAFGGGRFVAVGTGGTIVSSPDGITWTQADSPTAEWLGGVAYGGGRWIVVSFGGRVLTSTDGLTWTRYGLLPDAVGSLAYGGGRFVAVRSEQAYSSDDGATWETHALPPGTSTTGRAVQYTEQGFLVLLAESSGHYLVSTDGRFWEERGSATSLKSLQKSATFADGRYVTVGAAPDPLVMTYDNAAWLRPGTILQPPETRGYRAIATNAVVAVAVGEALDTSRTGALVSVSSDGANWVSQSVGSSNFSFNAVTYGFTLRKLFVAVGQGGVIALSTSETAEHWTLTEYGSMALHGVRIIGSDIYVVGDRGTLARSSDGTFWVDLLPNGPTNRDLYQIAYGYSAGIFVVASNFGRVLTSPDGKTWTERPTGVDATFVDVIFAAGKFVMVSTAGDIMTSTDGINWSRRAIPGASFRAISYVGGGFLALGTGGSYWTSPDGATWTPAQTGDGNTLSDVGEFKSRLLAVGQSGAILVRDPPLIASAPRVTVGGANLMPAAGSFAMLTVVSSNVGADSGQWQRNGAGIEGTGGGLLTFNNVQPANTGLYSVVLANENGSVTGAPAVLGLATSAKVVGTGAEVGADIAHPNGNIFDQVLLNGAAATITADAGQITRLSYIDLSDDIVQVEFSGPGTLSLVLDNASGPKSPVKYNQAAVDYMRGHAGIVVAGATENTHLSVFSVGRATALNQALFRDEVAYDGFADLAFVAIASANGKFGGLRLGNARFLATRGVTGVYAPGVTFTGAFTVGDIVAADAAIPALVTGSVATATITGGSLLQLNQRAVQVAGVTALRFAAGTNSHDVFLPAQTNQARLEQDGVDVTARLVTPP